MDKATECDSGNERWKWSEWKIWIPAAKKEKKNTKGQKSASGNVDSGRCSRPEPPTKPFHHVSSDFYFFLIHLNSMEKYRAQKIFWIC